MRYSFSHLVFSVLMAVLLCHPKTGQAQRSITASIAYQNEPLATGEYEIFLKTSTASPTLTRPIIVVEGWDPLNQFSTAGIYGLLNQLSSNRLASRLRAKGYDVVVLNFDDGAGYIQSNAFLLIKLIQDLNAEKANNGSTDENVVVGVSMGGLVSRYALSYMEQNNLDHDTRMFIPYDSPHQGAHMPLGYQHVLTHYTVQFLSAGAAVFNLFLNRPATRQMLYYWVDPALQFNSTYTPSAHPDRNTWLNEMSGLGNYPQNLRTVAISNGSKRASAQLKNSGTQAITEGDVIFNGLLDVGMNIGLRTKEFTFRAHGPNTNTEVFQIFNTHYLYVGGPIWNPRYDFVYQTINYYATPTPPFDYCPGSTNPIISDAIAEIVTAVDPDIFTATVEENITFIPTISALDIIPGVNNALFYNVGNDEDVMCKMPFSGFFARNRNNAGHIDFPTNTANFIYNQIVDGNWDWNINDASRSFNFGENTSNYIFQDVTVENGGLLGINVNGETDEYNTNRTVSTGNVEPFPVTGSTFRVWTPTCNATPEITIGSGGQLTVGDPNGNVGILELNAGSTLRIGNGGSVLIHAGSRIIIEEGANLIIEQGASLTLSGYNSVLEVNGTLEVLANATFQPLGDGLVIWGNDTGTGPNIVCQSNSAIDFQGTSATNERLRIKDGARFHPDTQLESLNFQDCLINMGQNAYISTSDADFVIDQVKVKSYLYGIRHRGIFVNGQSNHSINGLDLEGADVGITARQFWNQGAPLRIQNSSFYNCDNGIKVFSKGVHFTNVNVGPNRFQGYDHDGATFYSSINGGNFSNNGYNGITYHSGGGSLALSSANADHNNNGVLFTGNGSLIPTCGSVSNNQNQGISVYAFGSLEMDNSRNGQGAQMLVRNNRYSLRLQTPSSVLMENGVNDLVPATENNRELAIGYIPLSCSGGQAVIQAPQNHWNTRGGVPGTDPNTTQDLAVGANGCLVDFNDPTPKKPSKFCVVGPPYDPGNGYLTNTPLFGCQGCSNLNTVSFQSIALNEAVQQAIFNMEEFSPKIGNDLVALGQFEEILTYGFAKVNAEEQYLLDLAYTRMKACFAHALESGAIPSDGTVKLPFPTAVQAMENVIHFRLHDALGLKGGAVASDEIITGLRADAAVVRYGLGLRGDALSLLDTTLADTAHLANDPEIITHLKGLRCLIETEQRVFDGSLKLWDFETSLALCNAGGAQGTKKMAEGTGSSAEGDAADDLNAGVLEVEVFPNPSSGDFNVWLRSAEAGKVQLTLFGADGRQLGVLDGGELESGVATSLKPGFSGLANGVYFLRIVVGDQVEMKQVLIR